MTPWCSSFSTPAPTRTRRCGWLDATALGFRNGHDTVVHHLLDAGTNMNANDWDSRTPLHWRLRKGHDAVGASGFLTPALI